MSVLNTSFPKSSTKALVAALFVAVVAGCSTPGPGQAPDGIFDPAEATNRKTHELNRSIDRAVLRPVSKGYVSVVPVPVQNGVSNFASNLAEPSHFANNLLQGNIEGALINTVRFIFNSTFGLAGLIDIASDLGVKEAETDFGETLHVWGAPEGAYVELPLLGPSTERDAVGKVVDMFTNPLSNTLPDPEKYYGTAARVMSRLGDRGRYSDTIDSILYESADSYAQSRIIYLQNRRFELGADGDAAYSDPYVTGTTDPYENPYAE